MHYRRRTAFVALLAVGLLASAFLGPAPPMENGTPNEDRLVRPGGTASYVWPYTSRVRSVEGRTLALNVIVHGEPERIRRALERRSDANWTVVEGDVVADESPWRPVRGAARYTYVGSDRDRAGRWVEAEYQLGTGTYLGRRTHIRAYPAPAGNWTAFQAHTEYWDWFRLRHTVTGVTPGARFVERDLRGEPMVEGISREYHGFGGGGSDGWVTVIEFVPAVLAAGVAVPLASRRAELPDVVLPTAITGVVLGVRAAGIAAEATFPTADPKLFAAVLYPALVAGPPLLASALARDRPSIRVAFLAAVGLGVGIVLDMGATGVASVPVRLAIHRVVLAGALGLFTLGVARDDRRTVWMGIAAWVVALGAPLFGFV